MRWPILLTIAPLLAADRAVDPTFLHRNLADAKPGPSAFAGCTYRAVFGDGAAKESIVRGVARFGELAIPAGAACSEAAFASEEQAWYVTDGSGVIDSGGRKQSLRKEGFFYVAPSTPFRLSADAAGLRLIAMGFRIPPGSPPGKPGVVAANAGEVKKQLVGNHPPSTLYQLLMGDTSSTRDRIAATRILTSLFIMEITPGGTNFPHHHDTEEEIYLLLDGSGAMVAVSGVNGVEGRYPARPGDAYFYRLNTTVGFYNTGSSIAHILAVRSRYPFRNP